ncbi:MAG: ATP-binding protein [Verrucomicrobiota bacterium]
MPAAPDTSGMTPREEAFVNLARLDTIDALLPGVTFCFRATSKGNWWLEYVSPAIEQHSGVSHRDATRDFKRAMATILDLDRDHWLQSVRRAIDTKSNWHCQYRIRHQKTGELRWVSGQAQAHEAADGTMVFYGALIDITEQRREEVRLREDAELARQSFAQAPIAQFVIDPQTRFRRVNDAFCELAGRERGLLLQWNWLALVAEGEQALAEAIINVLCHTEQESDELELPMVDPQGSERKMHVRLVKLSPSEDPESLLLMGVVQDISDREQREEERLKASKFESLGLLAGGIAHDLNNIIMGISLNLELAEMGPESGEALADSLKKARTATFRAAALSHRLLTFAKGGDPVLASVRLNEALRSTVDFALHGCNLLAQYEIEEPLAPVLADANQICQVVENIVINAREACPEGGTLEVNAANVSLAPGQVLNLPPGGYVRIEIADKGPGIPRDQLSRIFDPYYTTKPTGSGIGLATAYSLIKKHNGDISVRSEKGQGTRFTIFLPICDTPPELVPEPAVSTGSGGGRLLVVDDDPVIQHSLGQALSSHGYAVEVASNGPEALGLYRAAMVRREPFDVVLLDTTIPGGASGETTLKALLEIDARAKVVRCSGYGDSEDADHWKQLGYANQLNKPSTVRTICNLLEELIRPEGKGH